MSRSTWKLPQDRHAKRRGVTPLPPLLRHHLQYGRIYGAHGLPSVMFWLEGLATTIPELLLGVGPIYLMVTTWSRIGRHGGLSS